MGRRYGFCSLALIPALTLWMASGFGLTGTNFSVIGNQGVRRLVFLLWGAISGNFFYLYTDFLMEQAGCRDRLAGFFLYGALLLLIAGVGLPYLPERAPGLSRLHVLLSFLAPVFLGIAQVRFLWLLRRRRGARLGGQWLTLGTLAAGALFLLFRIGMVSSLVEIYVTLGACLYLYLLQQKIDGLGEMVGENR